MSKRKDGSDIVVVPQPKYPDVTVFDNGEIHRVVPRDMGGGAVEYDLSKLPGAVAAKAEACVTQCLSRLPAIERDAAVVKKAVKLLVAR